MARAAASLDPDVRFRALYNVGLVALRDAQADSVHRDAYLSDAARAYREALLPFEKRLITELKSFTPKPVSHHICGDARPILADMASFRSRI